MLLDPVIASFCISFASYSPTSNSACTTAINQFTSEQQINASMNYLENYGQKLIKDNVNENVTGTIIVLGTAYNSFEQKQLVAQIPIQQYNLTLDGNIGLLTKTWGLKWHKDF